MISFQVGQKIPNEVLYRLPTYSGTQDFSAALTISPIILVVSLSDITNKEVDRIREGEFEISVSVVKGVPFITLDFNDGLIFDIAILNMEDEDSGNAINIIVTDSQNMEVKAIRVIGLDEELFQLLLNAVDKIEDYNKTAKLVYQIQSEYTTDKIHSMGKIQKFPSTKKEK